MKRALLLGLAVVFVSATSAQELAVLPRRLVTDSWVFAAGDVDGDTLADLITGSSSGEGFVVLAGRGNGTFEEPVVVSGPASNRAGIGDITLDGIVDIIAVDGGAEGQSMGITAYAGKGGGEFGLPLTSAFDVVTPLGFDTALSKLHLADINADGHLEAIFGRDVYPLGGGFVVDSSLFVAGSDSTGAFQILTQLTQFSSSRVAVADYNGDSLLDIATESLLGKLVIHFGLASGALQLEPVEAYSEDIFLVGLDAADFDVDGQVDLVAGEFVSLQETTVLHLKNIGDPTFLEVQQVTMPVSAIVSSEDIDSDGWPDVHAGQVGVVASLLNDGSGLLLPPQVADYPPGGLTNEWPILDFDGDGTKDLLHGGFVLPGVGDGTWVMGSVLDVPAGKPVELDAVDLDGNGTLDLVSTLNAAAGALALCLGSGDGSFAPTLTPSGGPWVQTRQLATGDLDGDGDADLLLTANAAQGLSSVWFNDGSGTSFPATAAAFTATCKDVAVADLDLDGHLDLAAAADEEGAVFVRLSNGQGGFFPEASADIGPNAQALAVTDLDANGVKDVVAALGTAESLVLATGDGAGGFDVAGLIQLQGVPTEVIAADFDGSGLTDLAFVANTPFSLPSPVSLIVAEANLDYSDPVPILSLAGTGTISDLDAADMDGDGKVDLVTTHDFFAELRLLRGQGDGTFGSVQRHELESDAKSTVLADLDSDGRLDAAVGTQATQSIFVLPNLLPSFPSLGYPLATPSGYLQLEVEGEPVPGQAISIGVTGLDRVLPGFLILGLAADPMPFHAGTLVPTPDVALPMLSMMPLAGRWPALPVASPLVAQAWFALGAGGIASTNAILGITK